MAKTTSQAVLDAHNNRPKIVVRNIIAITVMLLLRKNKLSFTLPKKYY